MTPFDLVMLTPLMNVTRGRPEIRIAAIDGPVTPNHPELESDKIGQLSDGLGFVCKRTESIACLHGTFVSGILCAKRSSPFPGICPDCTMLLRPIFEEQPKAGGIMPSATPETLAAAILECVSSGARVINLSLAAARASAALKDALDHAARRGVIVVAAAGNESRIGNTAIAGHESVIPVVAYDLHGRPLDPSNVGRSIGIRGLGAPGKNVRGLGSQQQAVTLGGTSIATPFVTGAIALLWSAFPNVPAAAMRVAIRGVTARRSSVVPPLLDAWAAYQFLEAETR